MTPVGRSSADRSILNSFSRPTKMLDVVLFGPTCPQEEEAEFTSSSRTPSITSTHASSRSGQEAIGFAFLGSGCSFESGPSRHTQERTSTGTTRAPPASAEASARATCSL